MSFCGYKYKFGLYAAHSNVMDNDSDIHFHNFTIALYINAENCNRDDNYEVERVVNKWFKVYQGKKLSQMELFEGRETTIEGMGNTFFAPLHDLIESIGYELVKLEIYENPIRHYSVSEKLLDNSVNEINYIPIECIPLIQLENDDELQVAQMEEYEEEVAVTLEPMDEIIMIQESSDTAGDETPPWPKNKIVVTGKIIIGFGFLLVLAFLTMYCVKISGKYPQGSDTFCHLYRADLLLKNIMQGNWFPLYDSNWYNGVEIMRYWGPIPLYIIAGLEWLIHSSVIDAYVVFLGALVLIGGCGWILWGVRYNRIGLAVFIGLLWFYMPENMRVVIYEGNLPRGVINALLPFFFYFLWRVMEDRKKNAIWPLMIVTALITLCHLGITLMLLVSVTIFIMIYSKLNHCFKWGMCVLGGTISGTLIAGLWVVPALIGGAASGSSTNQVMKNFFESALVSLNPFLRYNGDKLSYYFGLSIFIICILGIIFGTKKGRPGFITAIILFLCTTNSIYIIFEKLPFSQYLWMIRFIPIGLAMAMVSLIIWKQLRKWMIFVLCILLLGDCITSVQYLYFPENERITNAQAAIENEGSTLLLDDAKEITKQRMAVLDLSKYGAFAPYYISGLGKSVQYTFGAGWEGAATATNIVNLNAATENGWYPYLFDRALELGNDTVLIPIDNLKDKNKDIEITIEAAKISGYNLIKNTGNSLLFHKNTPDQFGVISEYKEIAIGDAASAISMIFPGFEEGAKTNLNEYTFEELSKYQIIYLSGFTYDDKSKAEELLLKLTQSGVQVYIDMNRVPEDKAKKQMEMFGVTAQGINFTETYPAFEYNGKSYVSLDFSADIDSWYTVYLNGLENVDGYCNMTEKNIPYIGTSQNDNLHFVGLNIVYYVQSTRDSEILKLVESIFGLDANSVPVRDAVPITITNSKNKITIDSEYDNVNTTLSSIDIFSSEDDFSIQNNLVVVDSGETTISIGYPHIIKGIIVTVIGLLFAILITLRMRKRKEHDHNEK